MLLALLGMLVASCSEEAVPASAPPAPELGMSLVQQRTDEGTSRVHLRVTNREDTDVAVSGVGIDWPGFPTADVTAYETMLRAGLTVDLPFTLPEPDCAETSQAPDGVVRAGEHTVRAPLDDSGRGFLEGIWERQCIRRSVTDRVDVRFGPTWRKVYVEGSPALTGTLELKRRSGSDPVHVVGYEGSVLLDVTADRVTLPGAEQSRRERVLVTVAGRCDPHSRSESKQTFLFRADVRIGAQEPVRLIVVPDRRMQAQAWDLLAEVCD